MESFVWLLQSFRCPNCGDIEKPKPLCAVEKDDEVGFFIVCMACHVQIVSNGSHDDFWDMVGHVPPNETEN